MRSTYHHRTTGVRLGAQHPAKLALNSTRHLSEQVRLFGPEGR
jgi:hypothetical protein